jgi:hypothetical protein
MSDQVVDTLLNALESVALRLWYVPWRRWAIRRYLTSERSLPNPWPSRPEDNMLYLNRRAALASEIQVGPSEEDRSNE